MTIKINSDESNINNKIFSECFKYRNPSYLFKDLYYAGKTRNKKIVNNANNALIELRNAVNREKIPNNNNPENNLYCWRNPHF